MAKFQIKVSNYSGKSFTKFVQANDQDDAERIASKSLRRGETITNVQCKSTHKKNKWEQMSHAAIKAEIEYAIRMAEEEL